MENCAWLVNHPTISVLQFSCLCYKFPRGQCTHARERTCNFKSIESLLNVHTSHPHLVVCLGCCLQTIFFCMWFDYHDANGLIFQLLDVFACVCQRNSSFIFLTQKVIFAGESVNCSKHATSIIICKIVVVFPQWQIVLQKNEYGIALVEHMYWNTKIKAILLRLTAGEPFNNAYLLDIHFVFFSSLKTGGEVVCTSWYGANC